MHRRSTTESPGFRFLSVSFFECRTVMVNRFSQALSSSQDLLAMGKRVARQKARRVHCCFLCLTNKAANRVVASRQYTRLFRQFSGSMPWVSYSYATAALKILVHVFLLAFVSQLFVACSINKRVSYNDEEGRIPEELIRKIKRKKTEKSWVLAHLGEPYAIDRVETNEASPKLLVDIYTFRFQKQTVQTGHAFYLLRAGGVEQSTEYLHIVFDKDIVKKSWMDNFPRPQIGTRIRHAKSNTITVDPDVKKVVVQPKNTATSWKIPILKKWLSPQGVPLREEAMSQPPAATSDAAEAPSEAVLETPDSSF